MNLTPKMKVLSPIDCYLELPQKEILDGNETFFDTIKDAELYASGRSALRSIIPLLKKSGTKTIWLPDFICPSLPIFFKEFFEVKTYPNATPNTLKIDAPDAILFVDFFGATNQIEIENWILKNPQVFSILDATFAPFSSWIKQSNANCIFASLRKLLPIPDGAYLKLKNEPPRKIASTPSSSTPEFVAEILSAMILKTLAKNSENSDAKAYRKLFMKGEEKLFNSKTIARISPYSFEVLKTLNITKILKSREMQILEFEKSKIAQKLNCQTISPRESQSAFAPALIIEDEATFEQARQMLTTPHNRPCAYWNKPDFKF